MNFDNIGLKDLLDWSMPLVLGWIGSGFRKYMKAIRTELIQAKDSVVTLNVQIAKLLERTEGHARELESHERRITNVETIVPPRRKRD